MDDVLGVHVAHTWHGDTIITNSQWRWPSEVSTRRAGSALQQLAEDVFGLNFVECPRTHTLLEKLKQLL